MDYFQFPYIYEICNKLKHNQIPNSFHFLLPISREIIVFVSNFQNGDFDGFTRLRSSEFENHIFSKWSVYICDCVSVISITQEQIRAETSNFVQIFRNIMI